MLVGGLNYIIWMNFEEKNPNFFSDLKLWVFKKNCLREYLLLLRPNKKISVFWVMGLTILGRVGTHFLFILEKI